MGINKTNHHKNNLLKIRVDISEYYSMYNSVAFIILFKIKHILSTFYEARIFMAKVTIFSLKILIIDFKEILEQISFFIKNFQSQLYGHDYSLGAN